MEGFESNEKMSCFIAPVIMFYFYYEFGNTLGAGKNLTFILILLNLYFIPFVSGNNEHLQCAVSLTSSNGAAGNVSLVSTFGASAAAVCV